MYRGRQTHTGGHDSVGGRRGTSLIGAGDMTGIGAPAAAGGLEFIENRLLAALRAADRAQIAAHARLVQLEAGSILFEPGDDIRHSWFPGRGTMLSLVVPLGNGDAVEAATIGREGALGGIVSAGRKPAFGRGIVQIAGSALRVDIERLDEAKLSSAYVSDLFTRYSDALLAQVMQSVACNAVHRIDARTARWLLTMQDRVGDEVRITHEFVAQMLGAGRPRVSAALGALQARGLIVVGRSRVTILNRAGLEQASCECHAAVAAHFERILPEIAPQEVELRGAA